MNTPFKLLEPLNAEFRKIFNFFCLTLSINTGVFGPTILGFLVQAGIRGADSTLLDKMQSMNVIMTKFGRDGGPTKFLPFRPKKN